MSQATALHTAPAADESSLRPSMIPAWDELGQPQSFDPAQSTHIAISEEASMNLGVIAHSTQALGELASCADNGPGVVDGAGYSALFHLLHIGLSSVAGQSRTVFPNRAG